MNHPFDPRRDSLEMLFGLAVLAFLFTAAWIVTPA